MKQGHSLYIAQGNMKLIKVISNSGIQGFSNLQNSGAFLISLHSGSVGYMIAWSKLTTQIDSFELKMLFWLSLKSSMEYLPNVVQL
jgi:hypothetical protein